MQVYSHAEFARLLGVSRRTIDDRVKKGIISAQGKPSKIPHSEYERLTGDVPVVSASDNVKWESDELFRKDLAKADDDEVKRIKARGDAAKVLEQTRKLKLESGEHIKRKDFDESTIRFGGIVKDKASSIYSGLAREVDGMSPGEIEVAVEKRVNDFLAEVGRSKWDITRVV